MRDVQCEELDEVEECVVGPVQVFEDEDGRALGMAISSRKRSQAVKFSSRSALAASRPSRARSR